MPDSRLSSREIFRVELEFRRRLPGTEDGQWVQQTYHALVKANFGPDMVQEAAELALRAVVGPPESWTEYYAWVKSVEHVGTGVMRKED